VDIETNRLNHSYIKSPITDGGWRVSVPFKFSDDVTPRFHNPELEAFERGGYLKEEEFARAVSLGLFDYLRKSYSQGFTISLSGGADSSACTALCGLMVRLAEESIGLEAFKSKLSHIKKIQEAKTVEDISKEIIHTIYQGTENSSEDTYDSAEQLAKSMGATFYNININGLVENYTQLIEGEIKRELSWETDDIALQNIQARVRAPSAWFMTNLTNHLLISTSNRSEVAVGYATMDGDTAGSISPIAGVEKYWLRLWLVWLEKVGCEVSGKHIKIEGLKKVNSLAPTAELRPKGQKQTDEDDLMPYEILNAIENLAVRDKKSPLDCYKYLEVKYAEEVEKKLLFVYIERFFKLWSRNQWKRERYAISFHLDDYNLDPRSWCRFPILSGSYRRELAELADYVEGKAKRRKGVIGF
jgi:NAD+ synthase (glutamine-hydrolysing)